MRALTKKHPISDVVSINVGKKNYRVPAEIARSIDTLIKQYEDGRQKTKEKNVSAEEFFK